MLFETDKVLSKTNALIHIKLCLRLQLTALKGERERCCLGSAVTVYCKTVQCVQFDTMQLIHVYTHKEKKSSQIKQPAPIAVSEHILSNEYTLASFL